MPFDSLKPIASKSRDLARRCRVNVFRRLGLLNGDWKANLPVELEFWDWALKNNGQNWDQQEWSRCIDPNLELQDELKALIPAAPGTTVRILDVGCGPLTKVGKRWAGRTIEIFPTDPLAAEYNALLARHGIKPLVPPLFAHGEKLLESFQANSFDLAYSCNALDHAYDPVLVIHQMLGAVKPSHSVYLWHVANEGRRGAYGGLHQWNFDIRKGEFVVDDGRRRQSINEALKGKGEVTAEFQTAFDAQIVVATIKKLEPTRGNLA